MQKASCLCGAVEVVVTGAPINSRFCHCRLCQKSMASPSFARALFDQADVKISGPIKSYPSSVELERLFCQTCGTSIAARRNSASVIGIAIALFEDTSVFPPTEHTWVSESVSWCDLDDGLVKHSEGAPNIRA